MDSKLSSRFNKKENEVLEPQKYIPDINKSQKKELSELKDKLKQDLVEKIENIPIWSEYTKDKQKELITNFVENKSEDIPADDKEKLAEDLASTLTGFGPLEFLIENENVSAIFVNGSSNIYIEIDGKILNTEIILTEKELNLIVNYIFAENNLKNSQEITHCKVRNLLITLILQNDKNIIIRKITDFDVNTLVQKGMFSREIFDFISLIISKRKNIVISGDINSGKTTFLKLLIDEIFKNKRVALVESFSQIQTPNSIIKFTCEKENEAKFLNEISKFLLEYILIDMNTSYIPSDSPFISTINSKSCDAAISNFVLEMSKNLPEKAAKHKILSDVDYIIQINKQDDGTRKITEIVELAPARTAALSMKTVAKLIGNEYVINTSKSLDLSELPSNPRFSGLNI